MSNKHPDTQLVNINSYHQWILHWTYISEANIRKVSKLNWTIYIHNNLPQLYLQSELGGYQLAKESCNL